MKDPPIDIANEEAAMDELYEAQFEQAIEEIMEVANRFGVTEEEVRDVLTFKVTSTKDMSQVIKSIIKEMNFIKFVSVLKTIMDFRVEWDDEQWNQAYISYKAWLDNVSPAWVEGYSHEELYIEFGAEFYQEATPGTHDYWLKVNSK